MESPRLKTLLILEQEDREEEGENHKAQMTELRTMLAKEREGTQVEGVIEQQGREIYVLESSLRQSKTEVRKLIHEAKAQQHMDMQAISEASSFHIMIVDI